METNKTISIIGSTGSIGTQAISVAQKYNIRVSALAAGSSWEMLAKQCVSLGAKTVCIYDEKFAKPLKDALFGKNVRVLTGMEGLCIIAQSREDDMLLNSVVGMIGLLPTLKAIEAKKDIALANKETLVAGGDIVMKLAARNNVRIFPVDSEHSAIFQCLQGNSRQQLKGIILTASGGPFFGKTLQSLENVTIEEALAHPNWTMGSKITIDSATLMNKGLEFIEAKWLFDLRPEDIEIVVHRQSVVHSAVVYKDNSVIAQLGVPDMKIPIQYALLYSQRRECDCGELSLTDYGKLTFEKPDIETFGCLKACIEAIKRGGAYPCIVNGANEEAVKLFLKGKIGFNDIGRLVAGALDFFPYHETNKYEDVTYWDLRAREFVLNKTNQEA